MAAVSRGISGKIHSDTGNHPCSCSPCKTFQLTVAFQGETCKITVQLICTEIKYRELFRCSPACTPRFPNPSFPGIRIVHKSLGFAGDGENGQDVAFFRHAKPVLFEVLPSSRMWGEMATRPIFLIRFHLPGRSARTTDRLPLEQRIRLPVFFMTENLFPGTQPVKQWKYSYANLSYVCNETVLVSPAGFRRRP
jgi:hypothetical protein